MRSSACRIVLKIVILLGCIACVITKALTDQLSRRVFLRNQKLSREWGLLHNLYWSSSGNAFANVTFGGFTLITVLMLISRFIDSKSRPSLVEKIFLTVGMLCFFAMGGVVFSAFDQVPADLHVNAIVLGCLSFGVALLMLIDLADPMARHRSDTTQTDPIISNTTVNIQQPSPIMKAESTNVEPSVDVQYSIAMHPQQQQQHRPQPQLSQDNAAVELDPSAGLYTRGDTIDYVHARSLPIIQSPTIEHVNNGSVSIRPQPQLYPAAIEHTLLPEKLRSRRENHPDTHRYAAQLHYANLSYAQEHMQPVPHPTPPPPVPKRTTGPQPNHPPSFHRQYSSPPAFGAATATTRNAYNTGALFQQPNHQYQQQQQQQSQHHHHPGSDRPHSIRSVSGRKNHQHCGNDDIEENVQRRRQSAIQPGFVAHAARVWDQRASRRASPSNISNINNSSNMAANSELNTIV